MDVNTAFVPDFAKVSCIEIAAEGCDIAVRRGGSPGLDGRAVSFARCGVWYIKTCGESGALILPESFDAVAFKLKGTGTSVSLCPLRALDISVRISDGTIAAERLSARSIHAELGRGRAELCLEPALSAFLECGMGSMRVKLAGTAEDYRIRTERGIGKLSVSGRNTARAFSAGTGKRDVFARCGMGELFIGFSVSAQ